MRLEQLQKKYITEGWNDPQMLLLEQKVINPFVSNVERIVLEAELTADQIKQVFANVEQGATDAGGNRTAAGKGVDAVKNTAAAINQQIDKLGAAIQKAGPVQNIDAKFKELKQKIGDKDSKVVSAVKAVSDWAKENPGKASVAVAILTSAAALAGGPLGGLVGGFLARATKDVLQGKELSTAVGKSIKTGAIGALAGGAIEVIGDLVDPDISQAIIASDGQTIDVGGLEGMTATSIENITPEAAEDLLKTQNALETALKNVTGEEQEIIQAEFAKVSQKIGELGGIDELADHAGLEGQDLQTDTTTTTDVGVKKTGDATAGADGPAGDSPDAGAVDSSTVEITPGQTIEADTLKEAGINFDTEPNISPEVRAWAESKGIDADELQKMFQMEKAMTDAEFMGTTISANESSAMSWSGDDVPTLGTTTLPDGTEIQVGDRFSSQVSTSVGGIEPPINFTAEVSIQGVDANGDAVFVVKSVQTMETHPVWDNIDKANLSEEDSKQLFDFLNAYSGTGMDSKAGIETLVDTFKQDVAKSIGAAAVAVAMSVALQDKKVVAKGEGGDAAAKEESINYKVKKLSEGQIYMLFNRVETVNTHMLENKLMFESVFDAVSHYHRQNLNEGPMDAIKGAASKVGGALKTGAKAVGGAISGAAKQVTTKVTAEKLNTAWKKAGSPTDSAEVYDVIKGLGVADDVIKGTYDSMKIEVPGTTDAPDADKDADAADQSTDDPNATTAGDAGDQATDVPASDQATDAAPDDSQAGIDAAGADAPGGKQERYYLQKNTKDETKVDIIDKQTSKPIKNGVALAPEKAEPMSDKMNKEAGKYSGAEGDKYIMQPNAQNPKTYDVLDTQTDQPVQNGAALQPGEAEELRDKMNSEAPASTTDTTSTTGIKNAPFITVPNEKDGTKVDVIDSKTKKPVDGGAGLDTAAADKLRDTKNAEVKQAATSTDGATDTDTASTSGDQAADSTTTPTDQVDANKDGLDDKTGNPMSNTRGGGQGKDTAAPGGVAPVDVNALAAELKKLNPEQIEDAKKLLAA